MRDQNGDVGAAPSRRAFATEIPITRCNSCVGAGILQNVSTAIGFALCPAAPLVRRAGASVQQIITFRKHRKTQLEIDMIADAAGEGEVVQAAS